MQEQYTKIEFLAANYSRLQGLRAVPVGLLAVYVSVWAISHRGPADLGAPIVVALSSAVLYWLTDRYYTHVFGQVKQTPRQRRWNGISSILFGTLGLLAFFLDTTQRLPMSTVGVVFAVSFLEYFVRVKPSQWRQSLIQFPEQIVSALLILACSLLPLFGVLWWKAIGIRSQVIAVLLVVGLILILTGIWGHWRMVHVLSAMEVRADDITV